MAVVSYYYEETKKEVDFLASEKEREVALIAMAKKYILNALKEADKAGEKRALIMVLKKKNINADDKKILEKYQLESGDCKIFKEYKIA